jgi:hypothetical protein
VLKNHVADAVISPHHDGLGAVDDGEPRVQQDALFMNFSLDRAACACGVSAESDKLFVELDGVQCEVTPFYSEIASIDPELATRC